MINKRVNFSRLLLEIQECGDDEMQQPDPVAIERIPGGRAADFDPAQFDQKQLALGIGHELEHSHDIVTAMEIAMDHLTEDPQYYTDISSKNTHQSVEPRIMSSRREAKLEDIYCSVDPRHDPQEPWDPNPNQDVNKDMKFRVAHIFTRR